MGYSDLNKMTKLDVILILLALALVTLVGAVILREQIHPCIQWKYEHIPGYCTVWDAQGKCIGYGRPPYDSPVSCIKRK